MAHDVPHMALEDARLDGLIPANPAARAVPPKRDPRAEEIDDGPQIWTVEQVARFLDAVEDHPGRALWHLAVGTGARRAELLGVRWRDVNLEDATVTFQRSLTVIGRTPRLGATKSGRRRTLAVGPTVVAALRRPRREQAVHARAAGERWRNRWQLVFTHPDGRNLHPHVITAEFRQPVRELDVPAIRLHDLRHTHASLLLAQGTPMKVISERLEHSSFTVTMDTYAHLLPGMDQEAVAVFDAAIHSPDG